jgi:cell wall-associated NlpC family hydrolase
MIERRHAIVAEARSWKGTPFVHQGRLKHHACDCIGLIWRVGEACCEVYMDPDKTKRFLGYSHQPNPRMMREALELFFVEIERDDLKIGDFVWIEWRENLPMHLGIVALDQTNRFTIIHALKQVGKVVEHGFTDEWRGRVNSCWRYPGLA